MTMCFVLRLLPDHLAESQVVGRVEVVDTGERATFRDAEELIAFLCERGADVNVAQSDDAPHPSQARRR
jgi:hypothetical protein